MKILSDNLGATFIAKNPIGHIKLKHLAIDLHFTQERTNDGTLQVQHVEEIDHWSDILTKALPPKSFSFLQSKHVGQLPQV